MSTSAAPFVKLGHDLNSTLAAHIIEVIYERGAAQGDAEALCAWARTHLNVDTLWEEIGPIIDDIEARVVADLGDSNDEPSAHLATD